MRVDRGFLSTYVDRFLPTVEPDWLRSCMECINVPVADYVEDPAHRLRELQVNLERIYVPTDESIRIGSWLYSLARGFVSYRYQSPQDFVEICMGPTVRTELFSSNSTSFLSADSVPIYAIDGLPGAGKSALFRALTRVFPQPQYVCGEGMPQQRIGTRSALWISITPDFSLKSWIIQTLLNFGFRAEEIRKKTAISDLSALMFKTLYRSGVAMIFVDELQFASGKTSALRVLSYLLAMRDFGVPITFFANTDLLKHFERAPAQVSERIPHDAHTFSPPLREEPNFRKMVAAQLALVPFGSAIDLEAESKNIYDMTAGLPRATARLLEIASQASIMEKRPLTMLDFVEARRSRAFESIDNHISLVTSMTPVDAARFPELSSANRSFNALAAYRAQLDEQRISDAAEQALYSTLSETERDAANAASTEILRQTGKIPPNVSAIGEAQKRRPAKNTIEDGLKNSFAANHLAKFTPKNDTRGNDDDPTK